ncbi:MAG TPA: nitroreductase family deazaflavin-dependent oxidoreductase [Ktedonobacteraceae bacterium]|nr:nitroreductase family deazaflavin-dependent oxidoreductase [Ktedonobacteraceae bacterium]
MPTKIKDAQPPRGLSRMMYRLPIWLYHIHQGWIVGERFMLLTHTGRKSGLPRQTVLEVLQHDKASDTYYVLAGFGEKSDWLQNVEKTPEVVINVGRRQFRALATHVAPEEAELKVLDYAHRNPLAIRVLPRLMGYQLNGTEEDFRALAHIAIVIAFHPEIS